ncbi:hypothetical protein SBOR_7508 [Sclerotinia borealis F-4128]|uniref:2EXR domain-containing protein n=1 Tax=Sclerotinia borealis (strain F-4128) TaxID=1432307 RepID=W9C8G5_SCLBF|nr:hypothetical protein SBOR_7508 [Sclerotinia borealis F-4128]
MSDLAEFTLFPKLSSEIKAMVWDLASQEPNRILFDSWRIRKRKYPKRKVTTPISERDRIFCGRHPDYPNPRRLWAQGRVPAVLITCRESRYWAMKHYSLCFGDQLYYKSLWFNPKVDTLIFSDMFAAFCFGWGGVIKRGAIPLIRDSFTMPVVERVVVQDTLRAYFYEKATEMASNFRHLKSLVMRTDGVPIEINSVWWWEDGYSIHQPSLRIFMQMFWDTEWWKATRAVDKKPEFQIMTPEEMWDAGFAKPLGPSHKLNRRPKIYKAKAAQLLPLRRSNRIKAIEATSGVEL